MNSDHFAIVIGLSSYPNLGDPPPANLLGPENDADAVMDWLTDPNGGGLPAQNIRKVRSSDALSPPNLAPTPSDLDKAFLWLDELASKKRPRKVGTRIYLYVSGHGFSARPSNGCLLTGNAADRQYSANICPSAWLDWLRDAAYFNEYILWMDCCMDRVVLTQPTPPPLDPLGQNGIGRAFIAFAAPRPLKATEKPVAADNGRVHGVFTWNLLLALRGAAANKNGLVHTASLANWLREAQLAWLDKDDRANPTVAKEPAIVAQDPGIVFAQNVAPSVFEVTLRIPSADAGIQLSLWAGDPPKRIEPPITVSSAGTKLSLKPGLYVAEGSGLRHGFAVTRSDLEIDLDEKGDPVTPADGPFTVRIDPDDPSADLRVCNNAFDVVTGGTGQILSPPLAFGLYLIRRTTGRQITEKVILLDRDWPPAPLAAVVIPALPPVPPITSAAPLPNTRATHEYHEMEARAQIFDVAIGDGAELMVMARQFSNDQHPLSRRAPWQDVSVLDSSNAVVMDLAKDGRRQEAAGIDAFAACSARLKPGTYKLRYPIDSLGLFAQNLIIPHGQRMEAYILHRDTETSGRPAVSLLMRSAGQTLSDTWGSEGDVQLQKAIVALADERPMVNEQLLSGALANPLARIVGAHLLLLSANNKPDTVTTAFDRLNQIVMELRSLVGTEHPDVEALSLKCSDPKIRTVAPQHTAPMFERSWQLLLEGSQTRPALVPAALWSAVHATGELPPYLAWSDDRSVQEDYRRVLVDTIFAPRTAAAQAPISVAERAAHSLEETLKGLGWNAVEGIEKLRSGIDAAIGRPPPPPAAPPGSDTISLREISDQEIARRAQDLNLPPAAIELLRQDVVRQSGVENENSGSLSNRQM